MRFDPARNVGDGRGLLDIVGVSQAYGGVRAVSNVSFSISGGQILGLIGPNGAGKTTMLRLLSGFVRPSTGQIWWRGQDITRLSAERRATLGLVRTFQESRVFPQLTVRKNVLIGCHVWVDKSPVSLAGIGKVHRQRSELMEAKVESLLHRFGLADMAEVRAGELAFGLAKRLVLCTAVAAEPMLLMLDEPVAGLIESEAKEFCGYFRDLRAEGMALLLVEHDMETVMSVCDSVIVLVEGVKIAEGTPREIQTNPDVIRAYLGST